MKAPAHALAALLLIAAPQLAIAAPAKPAGTKPATAKPGGKQTATARINIVGMHCEGCAGSVSQALKQVKGVRGVEVSAAKKLGTVQYDPATVKPADLLAVVTRAGYKASLAAAR